ncbi:MAG: hypothetical protein AB8G77_16210 [Rhodothermales bacterium]
MENEESLKVLQEIRDLQQKQVETQNEMLASQKEYMALYRSHIERVEKINNQAERIQHKSESIMGAAKKATFVIILIVVALLVYLSWILFSL